MKHTYAKKGLIQIARMNKKELLELIATLQVDKEEFWVLSSGALTLRGIYPDAGDLDIAVTNKGLEQLKKQFQLTQKENGWFVVAENIEAVCDGEKSNLAYKPELVDGVYVQNIEEYLQFIKSSTRQRDKDRIALVENYIRSLKSKNEARDER